MHLKLPSSNDIFSKNFANQHCFYILPFPELDAFKFGITSSLITRITQHLSDYDKQLGINGQIIIAKDECTCKSLEAAMKRFYRDVISEFTQHSEHKALQNREEVLPLSELAQFQSRLHSILMGNYLSIHNPVDVIAIHEQAKSALTNGTSQKQNESPMEVAKQTSTTKLSSSESNFETKLCSILAGNELEALFEQTVVEISPEHQSLPLTDPGQRYFDIRTISEVQPKARKKRGAFTERRHKQGDTFVSVKWAAIWSALAEAGCHNFRVEIFNGGDTRRIFITHNHKMNVSLIANKQIQFHCESLTQRFYALCAYAYKNLPQFDYQNCKWPAVFTQHNLPIIQGLFEMLLLHPPHKALRDRESQYHFQISYANFEQVGGESSMRVICDLLKDHSNQHAHLRCYLGLSNQGLSRPLVDNYWAGPFNLHGARYPSENELGTYYFHHDTQIKGSDMFMTKDYLEKYGDEILQVIIKVCQGRFVDEKPYITANIHLQNCSALGA